jgi:2-haloacid dehalogenase
MAISAKACVFDMFGTVVDWEGSMTRQLTAFAQPYDLGDVDWLAFAREWRAGYRSRT